MTIEGVTKTAALVALVSYVVGILATALYLYQLDLPLPDLAGFKPRYVYTGVVVLGFITISAFLLAVSRVLASGSTETAGSAVRDENPEDHSPAAPDGEPPETAAVSRRFRVDLPALVFWGAVSLFHYGFYVWLLQRPGPAVDNPWGTAVQLFLLSLAGIPLTSGFIAKFAVFGAAIEGGAAPLVIVGVLVSAVAAYFYVRVIMLMFFTDPTDDAPRLATSTVATSAAIAFAAVATVLLGILPQPVLDLAERAAVFVL